MSDPLEQLEALFARLEQMDELDNDTLEATAQALDEVARTLLAVVAEGVPTAQRAPWRQRLQKLLDQLPAAQEKVTAAQSLVARQMAAENRRMQSMKSEGKGFEGRRSLFQRNA